MCVLVTQSCLTLCDPMDCSLPGSSVHGILQARVLEWVAIPFSRGSSPPRDQTRVSYLTGRFVYCLSHQGSLGFLNPWHNAFHLVLKNSSSDSASSLFSLLSSFGISMTLHITPSYCLCCSPFRLYFLSLTRLLFWWFSSGLSSSSHCLFNQFNLLSDSFTEFLICLCFFNFRIYI